MCTNKEDKQRSLENKISIKIRTRKNLSTESSNTRNTMRQNPKDC